MHVCDEKLLPELNLTHNASGTLLLLQALPDSPGALPLSIFARRVYEAGRQSLRFQAALVPGGVDGEELRYWADNMFLPTAGHRYYCSNCSANADCVALLLDGPVVREDSYNAAMHYIRRRCRYGAAVLANQDDPEQAMQDDDVLNLVERWDDEEVERFFQGLVQLLDEVRPAQRALLLPSVPPKLPQRHSAHSACSPPLCSTSTGGAYCCRTSRLSATRKRGSASTQ